MMNIMFCGNNKVFDGMLIAVLSLIKHNKCPINLYVMTMDLRDINPNYVAVSKEETDYLEKILKTGNGQSTVIRVDISDMFRKEMENTPNMNTGYTPYTLLRLYADKVEGIPDKVLYLDVDIIINGDLTELFNIDMEKYEFAAAIDYLGKMFISIRYINAGIMLMNMKKIKETKLFERAKQLCLTTKMSYPDQDALNRLVKNKKIISSKYNRQNNFKKGTVIKHFCKTIRFTPFKIVNVKPWEVDLVRNKLKLRVFDDILDDYIEKIREFKNSTQSRGREEL